MFYLILDVNQFLKRLSLFEPQVKVPLLKFQPEKFTFEVGSEYTFA